jgi:hypothetical protein
VVDVDEYILLESPQANDIRTRPAGVLGNHAIAVEAPDDVLTYPPHPPKTCHRDSDQEAQ